MNYRQKLIAENKSPLTIILLVLVFLSFLASSYAYFSIVGEEKRFRKESVTQVKNQTLTAASTMAVKLDAVSLEIDRFAAKLQQLNSTDDLRATVQEEFETNPQLFSLNVSLVPNFPHISETYFSPYFERVDGETHFIELDDYFTDNKEYSWYHRPFKEGAVWTEPHYEHTTDQLMTTYAVPLRLPSITGNNDIIGVVASDVPLSYLAKSLEQLDLGLGGYGMLFNHTGSLISHPVFSYVRNLNTLDTLTQYDEFTFIHVTPKCFEKELDFAFYNGEVLVDDQDYVACTKVPHTDWTLVTRMSADMFGLHDTELRQGYINALIWITLSICILIVVFTQQKFLTAVQNNVLISAALVIATITVLALAKNYREIVSEDITLITNQSQRAAFMDNMNDHIVDIHAEPPIYIPTGMQINSLEFVTAHNVRLTGVVWQHFPHDLLQTIEPGVMFPNAVEQIFSPNYQSRDETGNTVIGWEFEATLREEFDYQKYPFDGKDIVMPLKHIDMTSNIILTPDLEAYAKTASKDNPAVATELVLQEWQLTNSYFNYTSSSTNTNFGLDHFNPDIFEPTLSYNLHLEREIVSPFVTALLPVLVMMCLLYACIVSMPYTQYDELRNNITAVIFTILLAHYSIREHLKIDDVVYLEIFYFLLYVVASIFMFISHRYFVAKAKEQPHKKFEFWTINTYWPLLSSLILVASVWTYY